MIVVCKHCNTKIPFNTGYQYTSCKCGKVAVDGGPAYTRIIGNAEDYMKISEDEDEREMDCLDLVRDILGNRHDIHGEAEDSFDTIAHYWDTYMRTKIKTLNISVLDGRDVALMMCLMKIARIQGDVAREDSVLDAIGYLKLYYDMEFKDD